MFKYFKTRLMLIWEAKLESFKVKLDAFKKAHWISDFPDCYDPKCFDCNLGSCEGCESYFNYYM